MTKNSTKVWYGLFSPYNPEICVYKLWRPNSVFILKSSIINVYLALSASFEYLCYGSTANILIPSVWGSTLNVRF